jgi:copper chaperone
MNEVKFKTNINCNGCINSVSPFLNALDNIDLWSVDIDNPDKILHVSLDDENDAAVIEAVKKAGYEIQKIT